MSEQSTQARDVHSACTELSTALREIGRSSEERSAFLEELGHQIRTPLTGIVAMVDLLMQSELTENQSSCAQTILAAANSLVASADELLDISRLQRDFSDLQAEANGLAETLTRAAAESQRSADGGVSEEAAEPEPQLFSVLVAEDNPTNQLVVKSLLERMGHECTVVENGRLAVDKVRLGGFDVVLMDCMMPELDGFNATREIRLLSGPVSEIPIIALTANAMKGDRERCLESGMSEYMAKPVRLDVLETMLARFGPKRAAA